VDFVAVLDQAIALLRQRGRLTYRTLQLQFQLDTEHLEALKDELIKGQRLAADEDGEVLVWTGDTATPVSVASPTSLPAPSPATSSPPDAERRQLTVLFCDLVDSTALSSGRVPAGCGYCFGTSPHPSERGQSASDHHSKPVFKTPSTPRNLHLSTRSPSTRRSSTHTSFAQFLAVCRRSKLVAMGTSRHPRCSPLCT
jgi:hypothetical protein